MVLATTNPDKLNMLRWVLEGVPIETVAPEQLPMNQRQPPVEDGVSHEAIARNKALDWSNSTSLCALASDGGLHIPALGRSWSSLQTRRFAGEGVDNQGISQALLELMEPFKGERQAGLLGLKQWRLPTMDVVWHLGKWLGAQGLLLDHLPSQSRADGFWVFPLWHMPVFGKTYDKLSPEELERVQDHWVQLRNHFLGFFQAYQETHT